MRLVEITPENWEEVVWLTTNPDGNENLLEAYMASNARSLLQSFFEPGWTVRAIQEEGTLIGFTMFGFERKTGQYELFRFMIGRRFQGKGYGQRALALILKEMEDRYGCRDVFLSTNPENERGKHIYEKFGFSPTGEMRQDEEVYRRPGKKEKARGEVAWYQDEAVTIRAMNRQDVLDFPAGFAAQGWEKPREQFERYFSWQEQGVRRIIVAESQGRAAGYATLLPRAQNGPFAGKLPEIQDFNVLIPFQNRGIGSLILDVAERLAGQYAPEVSLGVGLHSGYGAAQRLYVKRGYVFDGSGLWYRDRRLEPYAPCVNDDELVLYLTKKVR